MFFIFSKLFSFFINPLVWIVAAMAWGIFTKNKASARKLGMFAFVLLLVTSNPFIVNEAMQWWEVPAKSETELHETYDYGIVPGGVLNYYNSAAGRGSFGPASDRIMQAIDLYNKKRIHKIIISSGSGRLQYQDFKEADALREILIGLGIPAEDVLAENQSRNTHENAVYTKMLLDEKNLAGNGLLITSAWHMRRAQGCFKKEGMSLTAYPVDALSGTRGFTPDKLIIPRADAILLWHTLLHEWAGYLVYKVAGYL